MTLNRKEMQRFREQLSKPGRRWVRIDQGGSDSLVEVEVELGEDGVLRILDARLIESDPDKTA